MGRPRIVRLSIVAGLLVCGMTAAAAVALRIGSDVPKALRGIALDAPVGLSSVNLSGREGPVAFPDIAAGRWVMLTLGFTHCPDICPFILENLAEVEWKMTGHLGAAAVPQVVFLSVDPERDRPQHLANYVEYFNPGFLGLSGEPREIDRLVAELEAFYRYGKKDAEGSYSVTHSAEVYLIDPRGRLVAKFAPPIDPDRLVETFQQIRTFYAPPPSMS